jgi:two-component system chemotaxis response regulator CheB
MPKMDGVTFLANLMRLRPMPVVMISTLTTKSSDVTLAALELGAVDYIAKPSADLRGDIRGFAVEVQEKIRVAATANVRCLKIPPKLAPPKNLVLPPANIANSLFKHIVVIGASTGGTEAIKEVLMMLPAACPPVLIAQHIPPNFSTSFAKRLDDGCAMRVVEAKQNQKIGTGTVYIAPGDQHLTVSEQDGQLFCRLDAKPKVNRHRPAVDVLFHSVAATIKNAKAIGVLLTGMGAGSAVKLDAADTVLALEKIAAQLLVLPRKPRREPLASQG